MRLGATAAVGWEDVREELLDRGYDERGDADETGDEESRGGLASSSSHDLLLLEKDGEQGGVPVWMSSPIEEERLLLAMELAVGFM